MLSQYMHTRDQLQVRLACHGKSSDCKRKQPIRCRNSLREGHLKRCCTYSVVPWRQIQVQCQSAWIATAAAATPTAATTITIPRTYQQLTTTTQARPPQRWPPWRCGPGLLVVVVVVVDIAVVFAVVAVLVVVVVATPLQTETMTTPITTMTTTRADWNTRIRVYRDCSVWCFTVRHHPVHSKAKHCYGYRATCYWNTKPHNFCKHENRIFAFTEIVRFGASLCDITLCTQKQHIVMVTELHLTETPNGKISVNTKIGFSRLQRLWGLVFHCATSPCTLKSNTLLWLQSYMLLKHQTEQSL